MDMVQWKKGLSNSPSDFDYMQFQNVDPIVYVLWLTRLLGWLKQKQMVYKSKAEFYSQEFPT